MSHGDDLSELCGVTAENGRPLVTQPQLGTLQRDGSVCKDGQHATDCVGSQEVLKTCKTDVLSRENDLDESYGVATLNCRPLAAQTYMGTLQRDSSVRKRKQHATDCIGSQEVLKTCTWDEPSIIAGVQCRKRQGLSNTVLLDVADRCVT